MSDEVKQATERLRRVNASETLEAVYGDDNIGGWGTGELLQADQAMLANAYLELTDTAGLSPRAVAACVEMDAGKGRLTDDDNSLLRWFSGYAERNVQLPGLLDIRELIDRLTRCTPEPVRTEEEPDLVAGRCGAKWFHIPHMECDGYPHLGPGKPAPPEPTYTAEDVVRLIEIVREKRDYQSAQLNVSVACGDIDADGVAAPRRREMMPLFIRKPEPPFEAIQFNGKEMIRGVRVEEDGRYYVMTAHEQKVYLVAGDWIVQEPGNRDRYYPIKAAIFADKFEPCPL